MERNIVLTLRDAYWDETLFSLDESQKKIVRWLTLFAVICQITIVRVML